VAGGDKVQAYIDQALKNFDIQHPDYTVQYLLRAKEALLAIKDDFWKDIKLKEVDDLILQLSGTYLEVRASDFAYTPGDSIELTLEAVNRSAFPMLLTSISFEKLGVTDALSMTLNKNRREQKTWKLKVPANSAYSNPYWLNETGTLGMYKVNDQLQIGLPENNPALTAKVKLKVGAVELNYELPVIYKRTDPVDGEVYRPLEIQPTVMVNVEASALVFANGAPKDVSVRAIAGKDGVKGELKLQLPSGWTASPAMQSINLAKKSDEQVFTFSITAPAVASEGELKAVATIDGKTYDRGRVVIAYDHIPTQSIYPVSTARVVKVDLKKKGEQIGYIMGAGDDIPASLEQIGYKVTILNKDDVTKENLAKFQAVILGVRAFNTVDWLSYKNKELFEYVNNGGNVIVQYNTTGRLVTNEISPYDLKISRDRVAVEEAEVRILANDHAVLNSPNKITNKDFDNWVQERGLYFPNEWAPEFTAVLSANDPGEDPRDGGLLVAKYGKGYYVYTGYSWFRELPAGVSGAYRLFANLISLGE
jgi:hypothetical protein